MQFLRTKVRNGGTVFPDNSLRIDNNPLRTCHGNLGSTLQKVRRDFAADSVTLGRSSPDELHLVGRLISIAGRVAISYFGLFGVRGNNHFILSGRLPDETAALALVRHWSIVQIGEAKSLC